MLFDRLPRVALCCSFPLKWGVILIGLFFMLISVAKNSISGDTTQPCHENLSSKKCVFKDYLKYFMGIMIFGAFIAFMPSALLIVGVIVNNRFIVTAFLVFITVATVIAFTYDVIIFIVMTMDANCKPKVHSFTKCYLVNVIQYFITIYFVIVVNSYRKTMEPAISRSMLRNICSRLDIIDDVNISKYGRVKVVRRAEPIIHHLGRREHKKEKHITLNAKSNTNISILKSDMNLLQSRRANSALKLNADAHTTSTEESTPDYDNAISVEKIENLQPKRRVKTLRKTSEDNANDSSSTPLEEINARRKECSILFNTNKKNKPHSSGDETKIHDKKPPLKPAMRSSSILKASRSEFTQYEESVPKTKKLTLNVKSTDEKDSSTSSTYENNTSPFEIISNTDMDSNSSSADEYKKNRRKVMQENHSVPSTSGNVPSTSSNRNERNRVRRHIKKNTRGKDPNVDAENASHN